MMNGSFRVGMYLPNLLGGGAERVMVNLANSFADNGLSVDLLLVRARGAYISQVSSDVRILDLKAHRIIASLPGLMNYLKSNKPDALLSTLDLTNLTALLSKQLSQVSTRVVIRIANTISKKESPIIKRGVERLLFSIMYSWADEIVTVSRGAAYDLAQYTNIPLSNIRTIYNPIITPRLLIQAKEPPNHPWFASGQLPVILGVGRLVTPKDFATLIRAFSIVRRKHPSRLLILGEGEQRSHLENLTRELGIDDDVDIPGYIDNPYAYMSKASVFVLSSIWEGLPGALIEALACGCPVVSTDCPSGPSEILDNGRYGNLISVGDDEAMAQAILNVLSGNVKEVDPEWLNQFMLEPVAQQYLKVLGLSYS